jgi:hypothetical protein
VLAEQNININVGDATFCGRMVTSVLKIKKKKENASPSIPFLSLSAPSLLFKERCKLGYSFCNWSDLVFSGYL